MADAIQCCVRDRSGQVIFECRGPSLLRLAVTPDNFCTCDSCQAAIDLDGLQLAGIPAVPDIDRAILAAIEAGGGFDMDRWHTCGTTHCRGGWAIQLAGKAGLELECMVGSLKAAWLIYAASRPGVLPPDFMHMGDDEAMADIRRCAGLGPAAAAT